MSIVEDNPFWSAENFKKDVAIEYNDFSKEAFWTSYQYQAYISLYLSDIIHTSGKVLEVGCGPGWLGIIMEEICPNIQLMMTDHSLEMVSAAKSNFDKRGIKGAEFQVMDSQDLKLPDNCYDIVVSQFMLRHVPDPVKALQEAYRVLKPGGLVYFTDVALIDEPERTSLITSAPGLNGSAFIRAAIDSALPIEQIVGITKNCGANRSECLFGGIGGFQFPSREILDLVKNGFPLRTLQKLTDTSEWSAKISPYWAHIYLYK